METRYFEYKLRQWQEEIDSAYDENELMRKKAFDNLTPKELQQIGYGVLNLVISSVDVGLFKRILITVETRNEASISGTRFGFGDFVQLYFASQVSEKTAPKELNTKRPFCEGIIRRVLPCGFIIAVDETEDLESGKLQEFEASKVSLISVGSKKIYEKQCEVLGNMKHWKNLYNKQGARHIPTKEMYSMAFENHPKESRKYMEKFECVAKEQPISGSNSAQQRVAYTALNTKAPIYSIHGPPGTGKTTTLSYIVQKLILEGKKVLCCAASNVAVDNLLAAVLQRKVPVKSLLRLGHPARIQEDVHKATLDCKLTNHKDLKKLQRDKGKIQTKMSKIKSKRDMWEAKKELRDNMHEQRNAAKDALYDVFDNSQVVFGTAVGVSNAKHLQYLIKNGDSHPYDVALVDESAQGMEFETWNILRFSKRAILAGDPKQLPPVGKTTSGIYPKSLMERLFEKDGYLEYCSGLLSIQYRMHKNILNWSNRIFYDGKLQSDTSCVDRTLELLKDPSNCNSKLNDAMQKAFMCIDTSFEEGYGEEVDAAVGHADSIMSEFISSKNNPKEAELVLKFAKVTLIGDLKARANQIVVISPYKMQVDLLKRLFSEDLTTANIEIGTVDGFQGREADVVLISLVRSNQLNNIGFLKDTRRMNVAITRARKLCVMFGDTSNVFYGGDKVLKQIGDCLTEIDNEPLTVAGLIEDGFLDQ